jgi:hypothetical protein
MIIKKLIKLMRLNAKKLLRSLSIGDALIVADDCIRC